MNKESRFNMLTTGLVSAFMIFIIMLPSMLHHHGIFIIRGDYVDQYIPRLIKAKEILSSGVGTWDWFNFFGAPYNSVSALFSLNSLCLLFPAKVIPYAVTYMHLIRFAIVGMASFAYFSTMVKEKKTAFIGAILYTFSSYSFLNFEFMQFIEALWTFPLILLSVEKLFRSENYKHQLILAVFISSTVSFYFFVFSTITFSIYFVCRFLFSDEWRCNRNIKFFAIAIFEYMLGFLCAMIVFAPFIYNIFNSSGSSSKIGTNAGSYLFAAIDRGTIARIFSFFVPAASNRFSSFGYSSWSSRALYIPIFGISFVIAYMFDKNNKLWLKLLCIYGAIAMIIPGISVIYNFFSSTYTRFSYGIILFFVLATILFIENYSEKKARISIWITVTLFVGLIVGYYALHFLLGHNKVISSYLYGNISEAPAEHLYRVFTLVCAFSMYLVLVVFAYSHTIQRKIVFILPIVLTVYGCCYVTANQYDGYMLDYFTDSNISLDRQTDIYFKDIPVLEDSKDYRVDFPNQCRNYSYVSSYPSISIFESTRNSYTDEFVEYLPYYLGRVESYPQSDSSELRTLLGVKYYIDIYPDDGVAVPKDFKYVNSQHNMNIYKNPDFSGMGFTYDNYMLRSELDDLSKTRENCADIMLNTLVIEDDNETFVSGIIPHFTEKDTTDNRIPLENFEYTSGGFTASINTPEEKIVYVSIPYEDKGWNAKINGKDLEFINANIGFVAFKTEAGNNDIIFTYVSPSRVYGIYGTVCGIALLVPYVLIIKRKKLSVKHNNSY